MTTSHTAFNDLILDIFRQYKSASDFESLEEVDQRRLCAAYLRDNPEQASDILCDVAAMHLHVADLIDIGIKDADIFQLANDIRIAAFPNPGLISAVEAEMDFVWREKYRIVEDADTRAVL